MKSIYLDSSWLGELQSYRLFLTVAYHAIVAIVVFLQTSHSLLWIVRVVALIKQNRISPG